MAPPSPQQLQKHRRVILALYRFTLRHVRDLEPRLAEASLTRSRKLAIPTEFFFEHRQDWIERKCGLHVTVQELKNNVRTAYKEGGSLSSPAALSELRSQAIEGVSQLSHILQRIEESQNPSSSKEESPASYERPDDRKGEHVDEDSKRRKEFGSGVETSVWSFSINLRELAAEDPSEKRHTDETIAKADKWARNWIDLSDIEWLPPIQRRKRGRPAKYSGGGDTYPLLLPRGSAIFHPLEMPDPKKPKKYSPPHIPGEEDVTLMISKQQDRELYQHLFSMPPGTLQKLVVPFEHPCVEGSFAKVGLLYNVTDVSDVADQTDGKVHFACWHTIDPQPVRIGRILNPSEHNSKTGFLRIQATHEPPPDKTALKSAQDLSFVHEVERKLGIDPSDQTRGDGAFYRPALQAWKETGIWGFAQKWIEGLHQRLLQLEVSLGLALASSKDVSGMLREGQRVPNDDFTERMRRHFEAPYRKELLSLRLEATLTIPRLLHASQDPVEQRQILLELVDSESRRRPFHNN